LKNGSRAPAIAGGESHEIFRIVAVTNGWTDALDTPKMLTD